MKTNLPETELRLAIEINDVEKVRNIIGQNKDKYDGDLLKMASNGYTALQSAFMSNSISSGYEDDDNDDDDTIPQNSEEARVTLIKALLETQPTNKRQELLEMQFSNGMYDEKTPLHIAAETGQAKVVKAILETEGVDKQALLLNQSGSSTFSSMQIYTTGDRQTPLHYAVIKGHTNVVKTIMETADVDKKAILTVQDTSGRTPLHYAASANHEPDLLEAILKNIDKKDKAGVLQAKDNDGHTPLDDALDSNNTKTVNALLAHGAAPKLSQVLSTIFSAEISTRSMLVNYMSSTASNIVTAVREVFEPITKHLPTYSVSTQMDQPAVGAAPSK